MTYIAWASDFCLISLALSNSKASYIYFGYLFSFAWWVTSYFFVGHCGNISCSSDFALYPWLYLINKHLLWVFVQFHTASDHIFFVGHCDLYFMVQWFCPVSPIVSNSKASYFVYLFSLILWMTSYYGRPLWPMFHGPVTLPYISGSNRLASYFGYLRLHGTFSVCPQFTSTLAFQSI